MAKAFHTIGLLLMLVIFGACAAQPETEAGQRQPVLTATEKSLVTVYYATADGRDLLPITLEVNATTEATRVALEKLLAGPMADNLSDSIPTDTKLLDLYSICSILYVDLSDDFLAIPPDRAQLAVDALAATALPLADCDSLQVLVEGEGATALGPVDLSAPVGLPLINPWPREAAEPPAADAAAAVLAATAPAPAATPPTLTRLTFFLPDPIGSGFIIPYTAEFSLEPGLPQPLAQARAILGLWQSQGLVGEDALLEAAGQAGQLNLCLAANACAAMTDQAEQAFYQALLHSFCHLPGVTGLNLYLDGRLATELPKGTPLDQPLTCLDPVNRL